MAYSFAVALAIVLAFTRPAGADCIELPMDDVVPVPNAFIIQSLNALVPAETTEVSGDEAYWLCVNDGGELGFYAPRDSFEPDREDKQ